MSEERARKPRLPRPRLYPERRLAKTDALDRVVSAGQAWLVSALTRWRTRSLAVIVPLVNAAAEEAAGLDDAALRAEARALRHALRATACRDRTTVARCFALVREASERVLGLRHYDVQLYAGYALLRGRLAEMAAGEGKTLAATLAATTAALAGWPVHVVTVNDYLARRDADTMEPLYAFFGLSVGVVASGQQPDERRAAYAADITYCTNKELAFDYLRDCMTLGHDHSNLRLKVEALTGRGDRSRQLVLRGLHFAIVDEADSVLIDEARTPLIISSQVDTTADADRYRRALDSAERLEPGLDFRIAADEREVSLTRRGTERVAELTRPWGGPWLNSVLREELVLKALTARLLYRRDEHYLVRDGTVQIIDEYTGRVMPDRFWSEGLHQLIELKEGCRLSGAKVTLARMTYQRFFRRYRRLAGMTGTCSEVAREVWRVYRLAVVSIPTNRPSRRITRPDRVLADQTAKWRAIVAATAALHRRRVPVLLGTRSVAASETAARYLAEAGLPYAMLNAAQDAEEARIVAEAGQPGRITIATNMAGRGTDIKIAAEVEALGGLHVIMSERHETSRIDRQLAGRAARQGQPGWFAPIVALDDPLMDMDRLGLLRWLARLSQPLLGAWSGRLVLRYAQRRAERVHARMRHTLLRSDERLESILAFSGKAE